MANNEMSFEEFIKMTPYVLTEIGKALLEFLLPIVGIAVAVFLLVCLFALVVNYDLPGKIVHWRRNFRTNRQINRLARKSRKAAKKRSQLK